ncbi:MAG TPA: DsrE/DsrF/DrsH-like family protein [Enhygromyxa sp.]|nr:DsrE/DsrF/DrsH-like family protein [Enhygromyxa sp.]
MRPATIELDCRTQQCPVPVLRLAKAAGEVGDGGYVLIRADDPAFPRDLRAWARSAGSHIMRFDECGGYYEAAVRVGGELEDDIEIEDAVAEDHPPPRAAERPTQTFDLRGQPPPALLEILAKACARAEPGAVIATIVDDPDFPERLQQWLPTSNATLLALEPHDDYAIEVRLRVDASSAPAEPVALARPAPTVQPEEDVERCTLLVLHNDHEALLAALLIANGAAAQGMETTVFFTFWGLNLLRGPTPNYAEPEPEIGVMQRLMKWMMPKGPKHQPLGKMHFAGLGKGMLSAIMRRQQIMSLPELMDSAQKLGVRFTACTMSMSVMGIAPRDLHPYPNLDYGGVASFVDDARRSAITLVF